MSTIQFPPSKHPFIKGVLTDDMRQWVQILGQDYKAALLPSDIARGPIGKCFDSALFNTVWTSKYQYVEGIATTPGTDEWVYHAWLSDRWNRAFDPTWSATDTKTGKQRRLPVKYRGLPIPNAFVMMFVSKTEYAGVLGNYDQWPDAVNKMLYQRAAELKKEIS